MICIHCDKIIVRDRRHEKPVRIGPSFWHAECVRQEVERRAVHAGFDKGKARELALLHLEKQVAGETEAGFQRGDVFRFKLGYQLGVIAVGRKGSECTLCTAPILSGLLKGRIPWTRTIDGEKRYGQSNLCLQCVLRYSVEP